MGDVMNQIGTTITAFIKGMSGMWDWMTTPLSDFMGNTIQINNWPVTPLALFGVGFGVILAVIVVKEMIF